MRILDGTHRVIDSPHQHAEQRVAGAEELHFLGDEVLFLRLRFAGNGCGNASCRSHILSKLAGGCSLWAMVVMMTMMMQYYLAHNSITPTLFIWPVRKPKVTRVPHTHSLAQAKRSKSL